MRILIPFLTIFAAVAIFVGCSDPVEPEVKVVMVNAASYFPMGNGDTWYYNSGNTIRKVDGDTTVNGVLCKRILKGPDTDQAWSINAQTFSQHLFDGFLWFDPPLQIPLNMTKGTPFQFSSLGLVSDAFTSDADSIRSYGALSFDGYITRKVNNVDLDSCFKLDYDYISKVYLKSGTVIEDTSRYSEIWAKGIGMVFDGDIALDLANINGVDTPKLPE